MIDKTVKKNAKELSNYVLKIVNTLDDYDEIYRAMKDIFTLLTDAKSPRFKEFNETYKVGELAESKILQFKKTKIKKALGEDGNFIVTTEMCIYDKAPKGLVIIMALYDLNYNKNLPISLELYIDERNIQNGI